MNGGRFLHTGLTPHPVDLWAIQQYNTGIRRARDAYNRQMVREGFGTRTVPCNRCQRPTLSPTLLCYKCQRVIDSRANTPWKRCAGTGCTTRTLHPSGLCFYCRRKTAQQARVLATWFVCKRPGCGRATQNAALVCVRCRKGERPNGPGHHWSLRFRP